MNEDEEIVISAVIMPVIEETDHPHCAWFDCTEPTKYYEDEHGTGWFCDDHHKERVEISEIFRSGDFEPIDIKISDDLKFYNQEDIN